MFIVKEMLICTLDGTAENNILGLFVSEKEAFQQLVGRINNHIENLNDCEITACKEILDSYPILNEKNNNLEFTTNKRIFGASSKECWHEYFLEIEIEEIR